MEQIFLGLILFNAFFQAQNYQYDTFEISHLNFDKNDQTEIVYNNSEFSKLNGISLGSREYDQATPYFRYGQATYIYGQTTKATDQDRKLKQYGGYVGLFAEINYKRYFGIGTVIGGGATLTEFNDQYLVNKRRSNYFGLGSPYITIGFPITQTASINFIASTFYLSKPAERIDGVGTGFQPPYNLKNKYGIEFVWSWN